MRERIKKLTPEEREKLDTAEDTDLIQWFNRTKTTSEDKKLRTIPGSFYKVRAQGSASDRDSQEVGKIFKRGFISGAFAMGHSFLLVNFLYNSRLFTR